MKKILCLVSCVLCLLSNVKSQNLVPNPSFEVDTACPNGNKIYYALPWFQPSIISGNTTNSSSSDLYSTCEPYWNGGVPLSATGYQFARTDTVYAGIYVNVDTLNYREYLEVPLLDSLLHNHSYCVEFYVSLANNYGIAISNMGAYFSPDSLLDSTYHATDFVMPQVENPNPNMLSDTLNWMLVSGNFIANGGERFMTIGNFHLPANTNTQIINGGAVVPNMAYYYIDDVSVTDCGSVGVAEIKKEEDFKLYPNPNNGNFNLEYNISSTETALLTIYDVAGRIVKQQILTSENKTIVINATELNAGVYYYEIKVGEQKVKSDKLIIIK